MIPHWLSIDREAGTATVFVSWRLAYFHGVNVHPGDVLEIVVSLEGGAWTHVEPRTPKGVFVPIALREIAAEAVRRFA